VVEGVPERVRHVAVLARRHRERALPRRRHVRVRREFLVVDVVGEPRAFEADLREQDRVVLGVDLAFERGLLQRRQRLEPLLDGLVELRVLSVVVLALGFV